MNLVALAVLTRTHLVTASMVEPEATRRERYAASMIPAARDATAVDISIGDPCLKPQQTFYEDELKESGVPTTWFLPAV